MKMIETRSAAGHILAHDLTQIIPGAAKGARFKKGHIVTKERYSGSAVYGETAPFCMGTTQRLFFMRTKQPNAWQPCVKIKILS
mgnify:CR=1 FL=1